MSHQETPLEKRLKKRLKALGGRAADERDDWIALYPVGLELDSTVAIKRLAWKKLGDFAEKWRRSAERDVKWVVGRQREWSLVWGDLQTIRRKLERTWQQPGNLPNWPQVRQRMLAEAASDGLSQQQVLQHIATYERASVDDVCRVMERPMLWFGRQLDFGIVGRLSALAAADLGGAVSRFNITVKTGRASKPSRNLGNTTAKVAWTLLRRMHSALRAGRRASLRLTARQALHRTSKLLEPLVAAVAYDALQVAGRGSIDLVLEHHALDTANAIRSVLFTASAARMVNWVAGWPEDSPFFARWVQAATTTDFDPPTTSPALTSLAEIVGNGAAFDGKLVSVEGRVGPITIVHRGQKAISATTLTDPSGARIVVGLPYIKIDSGGAVPGAFARLTGKYVTNHADFDSAVLIPDRRNLAEEARVSWNSWVALEMQPYYWSSPHNLLIECSWMAGSEGPGNRLKYQVWAGNERRQLHVVEP